MISQLRGIIIEKQPPLLMIDINGVGYEVNAPMSTFYSLPELDQEVTLYTQLIIREDAHQLYGFISKTERSLFKTLIKVNGVGPKVALAILSSIAPDAFVQSIMDNNTAALVKLPGIGKKTAERLVIEMRDRLQDWFEDLPVSAQFTTESSSINASTTLTEAISALVALGYKQHEAQKAVKAVANADMKSEDMIRQALRSIADSK